jgi:hypothetical protein
MAGLRVFVSSTCYDLSIVRSQLRLFIQNIGHEPVMSDYNDILYDHREHTHTSCVEEVASSDVVVLIVGARYGGEGSPEALTRIDFEQLYQESKSIDSLKTKENLSVTQLEILKAIESGIPIFAFIDDAVWHDHALYEKNKDKDIINKIEFPSIQKPKTATFIFEFINFLRHRTKGNAVFPFSKLQDIEDILRKQWSALFQKLLLEQKNRANAIKRFDDLSEQFEDLKTAILSSIGNIKEREVARGVVRFRRLIDFVRGLDINDLNFVIQGQPSWEELLKFIGIVEVTNANDIFFSASPERSFGIRTVIFLIKEDRTFYDLRASESFYKSTISDWNDFIKLPTETREIIVGALKETRANPGFLRYVKENYDYYIQQMIRKSNVRNRSEFAEKPDDSSEIDLSELI